MADFQSNLMTFMTLKRPLGYERVYLPLCKVADTLFHIQGDEVLFFNLKAFNDPREPCQRLPTSAAVIVYGIRIVIRIIHEI